eukprot:14376773-Alexandrium_andersonii.AAC.1
MPAAFLRARCFQSACSRAEVTSCTRASGMPAAFPCTRRIALVAREHFSLSKMPWWQSTPALPAPA